MPAADQTGTLATLQAFVGGCREWLPVKNDCCWAPAEYVLWGKLLPPEAFGPRCYDHAAKHIHHTGLQSGTTWALIHLGDLARELDQARGVP